MRRPFTILLATVACATALIASPAAGDQTHTVTPLWFTVTVGPDDEQTCDIVGDLYLPAGATADDPVPALLTTNGFGGSKDDQAGIGRRFAEQGYAVLSYSGLGFGGSGCKITLDDPDVDGKAASQLVSYLGGQEGIAFTDAARTQPAPVLDVIVKDAVDNDGAPSTHDPRVGMVGGSYGGQVQYAAASIDPRIDTIVPLITWHDLSYSLSPNNTSQTRAGEVSTTTPGAAKLVWALGFAGLGVATGLVDAPADPSRLVGCPNFAEFVCPALINAGATGTVDPAATKHLRQRSVASYAEDVRVPTLIMQGQSDTLFNLNEGIATFEALQRGGTEVSMVWINGGHSGPMAPGELELDDPDPQTQHLAQRTLDWFDHHLKGEADKDPGPVFSYLPRLGAVHRPRDAGLRRLLQLPPGDPDDVPPLRAGPRHLTGGRRGRQAAVPHPGRRHPDLQRPARRPRIGPAPAGGRPARDGSNLDHRGAHRERRRRRQPDAGPARHGAVGRGDAAARRRQAGAVREGAGRRP